MDSEQLRHKYNEAFKSPVDKLSVNCPTLAKNIALSMIKKLPKNLKSEKKLKLLDIGCAKGFISEAFRVAGFEVHGIDYSDVAIDISKKQFPKCRFTHMDAFNPSFDEKFDVIFCKGFSGSNTHDIKFVADFSNKYIDFLNEGGVLIISSISNFRDEINPTKTWRYWNYNQINELSGLIKNAKKINFYIPEKFYNFKFLIDKLLNKKPKETNFYIFYQKI